MKKFTSVIMAIVFIISTVIMVIPANASQETSNATAENIDYIDALYFENAPTVDGYVSEEEWGVSSFTVEAGDAATKDDVEPYNRFIYWRTGDINDYYTWSYTVWMRWDENYFYIAAKVKDPDGHALKNGTTDTWNGDALQMRVDVAGPNAVTGGEDFSISSSYTLPWSSKNIPDFLFGYVQIAGGFTEAWENCSNKGMTSFSKNPMGAAKAVVAPTGSNFSTDTKNGITTYEIAIPWAYIMNGEMDLDSNQITALTYTTYAAGRKGNPTGGIGREFGISISCLDDGTNPDPMWDAYLAWGSGICTSHQTDGAASATGSNSVVLSEVKVTQTAGYKTYDPTSLLDATFSQENVDPVGIFYDYFADDFDKKNPIKYDKLTTITYDDPGDVVYWGGEVNDHQSPAFVTDIGGEHGNVLDFRGNSGEEGWKLYIQTSYGGIDYTYPTSFTFEKEFYIDSIIPHGSYETKLGFMLQLANSFYFCGYSFNDNWFEICPTQGLIHEDRIATYKYDLKMHNWYRMRFQYDNESCTMRFWLDDLSTDNDNGDGWGNMIFNTRWRYFYTTREEIIPVWKMMGVHCLYDNVKMYNFGSITQIDAVEETDPSIINGGSGTTTTTVTGGGQITIDESKVYKKDNQWHVPVPVRSEYLNATQLTFSFEYDATKAKFAGISGLAEGTYTADETEAGKVAIIIKNFDEIRKMEAGDSCFEIILDATDANATVKDLKLALTDSYVYTVTTGDTMTFVIIGCVAAIAIATSVVVIRRKKENE